jgi:23S rRNA (cytidine1920-2'-O)/16S rRNA (cytidine1409-2'-O)-methyltransferase
MAEKQRLDIALHAQGLAPSREKARAMIMAGEVTVDDKLVDKPGTRIAADAKLATKNKPRFVSRGGEKLAGALADFAFDPAGRICADVGASTGGFTDCLIQAGAEKVYAIDVGYGQLDYTLRQNPRVVVMERQNARHIEALPEPINLVVIDASFISLRILLPVIQGWLMPQADIIALVKPQFEAGKTDVGKGGVVKDHHVHKRVLADMLQFGQDAGFSVQGLTLSGLKGPAGNIEFLLWLRHGEADSPAPEMDTLIKHALDQAKQAE